MAHFRRSRAGLDFRGAQAADVSARDSAGGDIIHHNDPGPYLAFVREYLHDLDQSRTRRDDELAAELVAAAAALDRLAREFDTYQRFVSNRFAADAARAASDRHAARLALLVALVALALALLR